MSNKQVKTTALTLFHNNQVSFIFSAILRIYETNTALWLESVDLSRAGMGLTRSQEVDFSCSLRARITCRSYEFMNCYNSYSVAHDLHRMELFYKFPREKTATSTTSFQLSIAPVPHSQFPLSAVDLNLMDPGVNAWNIGGTFLFLNSSTSFSNCAIRFERTCCCSSLVSRHDQEQTTPEY